MDIHIENEIDYNLEELKRITENIVKLQETKNQQEEEQEAKTNQVEPNMAVMEKWIESVIGERKKAQEAKKIYESLTKDTPQKKREHVLKLWKVYYNLQLDKWMPPEPGHLFHIQKHKAPDSPSQFMINFIEATHNLFKIQQRRIDKLEK